MAHRTRIRATLAAWALNSAILPSEIDALDAAQFAAIDGDAGGLWTPSSKIVLAGANGLDVAAPFRALGASGFNASMQAQNWPERPILSNPSTVNTNVPLAWAPPGVLGGGLRPLLVGTTQNTISVYSDDGNAWTGGGSFGGDLTGPAQDIAYGTVSGAPGFLITSSANGKIDTSVDGNTWSQVGGGASLIGTASVLCYSASLGLWVAAGAAGVVYTSANGTAWTSRTTPAGWISGSGGATRIVWNPTAALFVVLPAQPYGKFLTSPDGITWTERTASTAVWRGLSYSAYDGLWMACSIGGDIAKSSDGLTWVTSVPATFAGGNDLAVNNSLWVATAIGGAKGGIFWSVDKGVTWAPVAVGNHRVANNGWQRIIFADNRFVTAHANGTNLEFALSLRSS
jgi:hypothetical protein